MKPTPSLATTYHLVAEDEQQREITGGAKRPGSEASTFQAKYGEVKMQRQSQSKQNTQAVNKTAPKAAKIKNENKEKYNYCQIEGHVKEGCFKLFGYPEWWHGNRENGAPKAGCVEKVTSPIPGLTDEQYHLFVKHFKDVGGITE